MSSFGISKIFRAFKTDGSSEAKPNSRSPSPSDRSGQPNVAVRTSNGPSAPRTAKLPTASLRAGSSPAPSGPTDAQIAAHIKMPHGNKHLRGQDAVDFARSALPTTTRQRPTHHSDGTALTERERRPQPRMTDAKILSHIQMPPGMEHLSARERIATVRNAMPSEGPLYTPRSRSPSPTRDSAGVGTGGPRLQTPPMHMKQQMNAGEILTQFKKNKAPPTPAPASAGLRAPNPARTAASNARPAEVGTGGPRLQTPPMHMKQQMNAGEILTQFKKNKAPSADQAAQAAAQKPALKSAMKKSDPSGQAAAAPTPLKSALKKGVKFEEPSKASAETTRPKPKAGFANTAEVLGEKRRVKVDFDAKPKVKRGGEGPDDELKAIMKDINKNKYESAMGTLSNHEGATVHKFEDKFQNDLLNSLEQKNANNRAAVLAKEVERANRNS